MKVKTLKNGLKLAIDKSVIDKSLIQIGFYILGGAYTENKKSLQYYHLLEHILPYFTSTEWPDGQKNKNKLQRKGIKYFSTSDDYETHILLQGNSEHTELMLDMLVSTVGEFQIDESIFDKEKGIVESELKERLNKPFTLMDDTISKIMTPKHTSAIDTNSNLECVKQVTSHRLSEFVQHALTPNRILFYMAGDVPKYSVFEKYKQILESIPLIQPVFSIDSLAKYNYNAQVNPGIFHIKTQTIVTRIQFRWKLNVTAFDYEHVATVDTILYCLKKQLTYKLRNELGLVYSINVRSFFDPINRHLSYMYIETDSLTQINSKAIVLEIIRFLDAHNLIFKNELIEEYKLTKKGNKQNVPFNASRLLWGKDIVTQQHLNEYSSAVTLDDIVYFYNKYLSMDDVFLFYGGPDDIFQGDD